MASKIILLVFGSTFATATLVSWISIQTAGGSLRAMIERLYPLSLGHAVARIDPWLQDLRFHVDDAARQADGTAPALASDRVTLEGLACYGAEREPVASWGRVPDEARAALEAPGDIVLVAPSRGRFGLAIASRPEAGVRRCVGVATLDPIVAIFAAELPTDETLLALVDGDGRLLAHAGRPPGDASPDAIALAPLLAGGELREAEIGGAHVIGTALPTPVLDWHVAIVTPFHAAYAAVLAVATRIFLIDLGIILAVSLLAYHLASRLMRPISALSDAVRRVADGESDLEIPEPPTRDEIGILSRTFNEMIRRQRIQREEIEETNQRLKDRNSRLEQANEVLNQLSITDGLTKLHNHRFFQDHLTREIRRVDRTQEPLSMLLIDIDDFKRLNDRHGHASGDEILSRIAKILDSSVRGSDLCARYGGEEFVILTPNTDIAGAYELAEKVRTEIAESSFIVDESLRPLRVTVSVGVAGFRGNRKRFFQKADQALYRAKAEGKNCVVVHDDDDPKAEPV